MGTRKPVQAVSNLLPFALPAQLAVATREAHVPAEAAALSDKPKCNYSAVLQIGVCRGAGGTASGGQEPF